MRVKARELISKRLIGKGSSSIIYETTWKGQSYARKDFLGVPSEIFEEEAKALVGLDDHRNVVRTYCWTVDEESCSLVIELMGDDLLNTIQRRKASVLRKCHSGSGSSGASQTLSHVINLDRFIEDRKKGKPVATSSESVASPVQQPFDMTEALQIIGQIAEGMAFLHGKGLVHGDLKPKNILIKWNGNGGNQKAAFEVKVADFGLRLAKMKSRKFISSQERLMELVRWRAPELFDLSSLQSGDEHHDSSIDSDSDSDWDSDSSNGKTSALLDRAPTKYSDVYSFGLTCWQILTGEDPYFGLDLDEVVSIISGPDDLRPELPSTYPVKLKDLVHLCLADEEKRPSFHSILEMLGNLLQPSLPRTDIREEPGAAHDSTLDAEPFIETNGSSTVPVPTDESSDISQPETSPAPERPSVQKRKSSELTFKSLVNGEPPEKAAQIAAEYLISSLQSEVFTGFEILIECASNFPDGRRAVFNATCIRPPPASPEKAIPTALKNLAKNRKDPHYSKYAMKLVVALTSDGGAGPDSDRINEEVAKNLDLLISIMKEEEVTKTRLLAAEAIANILVYREVRKAVRSRNGVVAAFVGFSNASDTLKPDSKRRADAVCLKGLQRLAHCLEEGSDEIRCSEDEPKTQKIVAALLELLRTGLRHQPELTSLVEDSLVALKNHLREMDNDVIRMMILKEMSRLVVANKLEAHTTVPGRMAIISMTAELHDLCEDQNGQKHVVSAKLRKFVARFKEEGGIDALMTLLRDSDSKYQREFALTALRDLMALNVKLPVQQLPFERILKFLNETWPNEVKEAAAGLLGLITKDNPAVCANMFMETERALEAILSLLENDPDGSSGERIASLLLGIAKENENACRRIAESDLHGLDTLVKYVSDHVEDSSRNDMEELLTATLVQFCKSGNVCQKAVIEANGHVFLVTSLQEKEKKKVLKENVAQGLLELLRNTEIRDMVLKAGFVTTTVGSIIDTKFACADIALGLALISTDPAGLNQIYGDSRSVSALLTLLERCPDPKGKDAAASVIARLYFRLDRPEDSVRRGKIAESCELFSKYLESSLLRNLKNSEVSHITEFLKAFAIIVAAEINGRKTVHECRVDKLLIDNILITQTDIQVLMLKILVEMSSDSKSETVVDNIRRSFITEHKIADKLFALLKSQDSRTENVKHALMLTRNLSLNGYFSQLKLGEKGSISLLLEITKRHESPVSDVTGLAVKALEKFLDEPRAKQVTLHENQVFRRKKVVFLTGKQVFLEAKGIETLAGILKRDVDGPSRFSDAAGYSIIILVAVARDQETREVACKAIFECGILQALNETMFFCETPRIKWQAAALLKLLAMYGPKNQVCSAMKEKGCLDALIALRRVERCSEIAIYVLEYVSRKSEDCRIYINGHSSQ